MTDAEIIKALEELSTESEVNFSNVVLGLIQRQQEEIDRLRKHNLKVAHLHYRDGEEDLAKKVVERLEGLVRYNRDVMLRYEGRRTVTIPIGNQTKGIEIAIEAVKDLLKGEKLWADLPKETKKEDLFIVDMI